jgi:hypothetical protein
VPKPAKITEPRCAMPLSKGADGPSHEQVGSQAYTPRPGTRYRQMTLQRPLEGRIKWPRQPRTEPYGAGAPQRAVGAWAGSSGALRPGLSVSARGCLYTETSRSFHSHRSTLSRRGMIWSAGRPRLPVSGQKPGAQMIGNV